MFSLLLLKTVLPGNVITGMSPENEYKRGMHEHKKDQFSILINLVFIAIFFNSCPFQFKRILWGIALSICTALKSLDFQYVECLKACRM